MKTTTPHNLKNNVLKTVALFLLSITLSFAQTSKETTTEGQTITVTIDNVKNSTGKVVFALHTTETWMKSEGLKFETVSIINNKANVTFTNVPVGIYAIMALHDENENNKMDFENGMPKENYGISNNPLSFGPPQFSEAKFEVKTDDLDLKIRF